MAAVSLPTPIFTSAPGWGLSYSIPDPGAPHGPGSGLPSSNHRGLWTSFKSHEVSPLPCCWPEHCQDGPSALRSRCKSHCRYSHTEDRLYCHGPHACHHLQVFPKPYKSFRFSCMLHFRRVTTQYVLLITGIL
jgi:hypothetical protein